LSKVTPRITEYGYFGDPRRQCHCSPIQVQRYIDRISGPLLDRIDTHIEVPAVNYRDLKSGDGGLSSQEVRQMVTNARNVQASRFAGSRISANAMMTPKMIKQHCQLDSSSENLLEQAMTALGLSARAYTRILKVARTIADLESAETVAAHHISEAINYRNLDRAMWR